MPLTVECSGVICLGYKPGEPHYHTFSNLPADTYTLGGPKPDPLASDDLDKLAKIGFEAWCSKETEALPYPWEEAPDYIREHWHLAARAIAGRMLKELGESIWSAAFNDVEVPIEDHQGEQVPTWSLDGLSLGDEGPIKLLAELMDLKPQQHHHFDVNKGRCTNCGAYPPLFGPCVAPPQLPLSPEEILRYIGTIKDACAQVEHVCQVLIKRLSQ